MNKAEQRAARSTLASIDRLGAARRLGVIAAACGDDNDAAPTAESTATAIETPTLTATASATPESGALYQTGYRSGNTAIDELMIVLEAGDGNALVEKLDLLELPCTKQTSGLPPYPQCFEQETAGTVVEVLMYGVCEPEFLREPSASEALQRFGTNRYQLAFVYDNGAELRVVVGTGEPNGFRTVTLSYEGGVIGISYDCGGELSIPSEDDVTFVVPPR